MIRTFIVATCVVLLSGCGPMQSRQGPFIPAATLRVSLLHRLKLKTITAGHHGLPTVAIPWDIAGAPDGSMWFTDVSTVTASSPAVGRVDPATGSVREFRKGLLPGGVPFAIIAAADGNMWFADSGNGAIGRVTSRGAISEYSKPNMSGLSAIGVAETSSAVWVLESGTHPALVHSDFSGRLKLFPLPDGLSISQFTSFTSDASGDLWFDVFDASEQMVLVERLPDGTFKQIRTGLGGGHEPCCPNVAAKSLYVASAGTVWFTTLYWSSATVTPNALGALKANGLQYYQLLDSNLNFDPYPSGVASDGKGIWVGSGSFGENRGVIFHVDGRGRYSLSPIPLNPAGLAFSTGKNRRLWLTSYFSTIGGAIAEVFEPQD